MNENMEKWLDTVLKEIRFFPDRRRIKQELQEHIEDRLDEYMEFAGSPGIGGDADAEGCKRLSAAAPMEGPEAFAMERALAVMGEPTELGRELNRQHKPVLGWLWIISNVLVVFAVAVLAAVLLFGWIDQQTVPDTQKLNMEEKYASMAQYYDPEYNHDEGLLYSWSPDWKVVLLDTEINFRTIACESYGEDQSLIAIFTSKGPYSFKNSCLDVNCSAADPTMSEHAVGVDEEGNQVGVYKVTFERIDAGAEWVEFSYDKFGERFSFRLNTKTGEVV